MMDENELKPTKTLYVEFTARFETKIQVPDNYTEDDLLKTLADIKIPENEDCKYCFCSYQTDYSKLRVVEE